MITFTKVTWYSKLAAVVFFIGVLPALTFYIGMQYQKTVALYQVELVFVPQTNSHTTQHDATVKVLNHR